MFSIFKTKESACGSTLFFRAADFLGYEASERHLVDRVGMNSLPSILAHAAFLDKPRSLNELCNVIVVIEETFLFVEERRRNEEES